MNLRIATNKDSEKIIALISGVLNEYGLPIFLDTSDAELYDIWGNYPGSGGIFKVLENDRGEMIGTVAIRGVDKEVCELRRMYLRSDSRGKGFGKYLLFEALSKAKSFGFSRVILETSSSLNEAIGLYKKFGFQPIQPRCSNQSCDLAFSLDLWEFENINLGIAIKYPWKKNEQG